MSRKGKKVWQAFGQSKEAGFTSWFLEARNAEEAFKLASQKGIESGLWGIDVYLKNEDLQDVCDNMLLALQSTKSCSNLVALVYDRDYELVIAKYANGDVVKINVNGDNGTGLIIDVVRVLIMHEPAVVRT